MVGSPDGRRAPRVQFALLVAIKAEEGIFYGRCQSLDPRGLFLETTVPFRERSKLITKFVLPGDRSAIVAEGTVEQCQTTATPDSNWVWVLFDRVSAGGAERIRNFLGSRPLDARATLPMRPASLPEDTPSRTPAQRPLSSAAQRAVPPPAARPAPRSTPPSPPPAAAPPASTPRVGSESLAGDSMYSFAVRFRSSQDFCDEYAENISRGGIFIRTDTAVPEGTPVVVSLELPESSERVLLEGRVVWCRVQPTPGLGIQFSSLDEAVVRRLEDYIERIKLTRPLTVGVWGLGDLTKG